MRLLQRLYDKSFPPGCVFCSEPGAFVCRGCELDLFHNKPACPRCAASVSANGDCGECLKKTPAFDRTIAPWRYAFPLDEAIRRFKFHARLHYVPAFLQLLAQATKDLPRDIDHVQPMPLHWRRRASRGFNQAEELARPLALDLELPFRDSVRRRIQSVPQSTLSRRDRRRSLKNHFVARHRLPPAHVLIVDDVMTTGASADALGRCLKDAGACRVSVLALARS